MARDSVDHELVNLAKMVLEHPALETVKERVDRRMLARFRSASPEVREQINAIMDNDSALLEELQIILDESRELTPDEEDKD